ncbi:MAG: hypothetical protein CME43_08320 [Haliea sp.]|nr:hypothetical protein [Haliea sp.]|tara:strand:+ start:173 stop:355 length:183 start_codon:yes stop_codon:yes gene_type:complete
MSACKNRAFYYRLIEVMSLRSRPTTARAQNRTCAITGRICCANAVSKFYNPPVLRIEDLR